MLGISAWHLRRKREVDVFRPSARLAMWVMLVSGALVAITGDIQARIMTEQQPMKMAAAEALYYTSSPASFSILTIGTLDGREELWSLRIPGLTSFLATGSFDGEVEGINNLQEQYQALYGAGDYVPNVPVTYWSFRLMIGLGLLAVVLALAGLWFTRRKADPDSRLLTWVWRLAPWAIGLPLLANTFGWIFTEMGRQPWTVFGLLRTEDSVSPSVTAGSVLTSLLVFTVLYGVLAVVELFLVLRYAKAGPPPIPSTDDAGADEPAERPLTFAY
jgi:Cytochrome bd-type quinol oxidase, subunit 1